MLKNRCRLNSHRQVASQPEGTFRRTCAGRVVLVTLPVMVGTIVAVIISTPAIQKVNCEICSGGHHLLDVVVPNVEMDSVSSAVGFS